MGPFAGTRDQKIHTSSHRSFFSVPHTKICEKYRYKGSRKVLTKIHWRYCNSPDNNKKDHASVFMGSEFKTLRVEFGIRHRVCPVYDHRGNGKVERLIRTFNERLRANPELLVERQNKLFYHLVSALRVNKGKTGKRRSRDTQTKTKHHNVHNREVV